jgi:4-nitrophenyl phosphatase
VLLDVDGTLWRGSEPTPGLADFFAFVRAQGIGVRIVTNNSLKPPRYYRERLAHYGVFVDDEMILTSAVATGRYLAHTLTPGAAVYVIGEEGLLAAVTAAGMTVVQDTVMQDAAKPVAAVVVGGDRCLTYAKLKDAVLLLQRGARLIGTNPDLLIPTRAGLAPETGTTLAALTAATGVAPTVIGKPARWLFDVALAQLGLDPAQALMVGDRLDTDIDGAQRIGMMTVLVTSGVDDGAASKAKNIHPDLTVAHLGELAAIWYSHLNGDQGIANDEGG